VNVLVVALGVLPEDVLLVLIGGFLVLLGAVLCIVGRTVLGASDKPARRLTQLRSRPGAGAP
jgi:hypothetical protein